MDKQTWLSELNTVVRPEQIVIDDEGIKHHSYDGWPVAAKWKAQGKQPYKPDAIVLPTKAAEVSDILKWATTHKIPVTP